jgi:hypothetical protein
MEVEKWQLVKDAIQHADAALLRSILAGGGVHRHHCGRAERIRFSVGAIIAAVATRSKLAFLSKAENWRSLAR